jgi:LPS-assembly lipoprotein
MSSSRIRAATIAMALLVAGCGFHLRGDVEYPFQAIFINSAQPQPIVTELKRNLAGSSSTKLVDAPKDATVTLDITGVNDDKSVLTLSTGGRVSEYALTKRVTFSLRDKEGHDWLPPGEIVVRRSYTFNESEVLARESEETRMLKEMQTDAVQQIMRRLQAARKPLA